MKIWSSPSTFISLFPFILSLSRARALSRGSATISDNMCSASPLFLSPFVVFKTQREVRHTSGLLLSWRFSFYHFPPSSIACPFRFLNPKKQRGHIIRVTLKLSGSTTEDKKKRRYFDLRERERETERRSTVLSLLRYAPTTSFVFTATQFNSSRLGSQTLISSAISSKNLQVK